MEVEELKNLDMITLVDMLARHTSDYMILIKARGPHEEFTKCKELIKLLTKEIKERKNEAFEQ